VLAAQFLPYVPFSVLNFLLGLTPVSWATFLWTLAVSILPADIILVALGRGIANGGSAVYWTLAAVLLLVAATMALRRWFARAFGIPGAGGPARLGRDGERRVAIDGEQNRVRDHPRRLPEHTHDEAAQHGDAGERRCPPSFKSGSS
jgi:hypothetical protein